MARLYTLEEARAILAGDVGDEYRQTAIGQHIHDFLRRQTTSTAHGYGTYLKKIALYHPGKGPRDWRAADLEDAIVACVPEASRPFARSACNSFFGWLENRDEVDRNEAKRVPPFRKTPRGLPNLFTETEQDALRHLPELRDRALVMLLLCSGIRNSEACGVQYQHINFELATLRVFGKGRKYRFVPLPSAVLADLAELAIMDGLEPEDYLWYHLIGNQHRKRVMRNRRISDDALRAWWKRCLDTAGVEYRHPHIARHTYATAFKRYGGDSAKLCRILGHSSVAITDAIYTHLEVSDLRSGVDEVFARRGW